MSLCSTIKFPVCFRVYSLVIRSKTICVNTSASQSYLRIFESSRYFNTGVKSTMEKATGNRLTWKLTTEGIKKSADELIATHKKIWDTVGSVKLDDVSYENVMKVNNCGGVNSDSVLEMMAAFLLQQIRHLHG